MSRQPLAEVFGFPIENQSPEAFRYREKRLCPFNNRVPNCTKDKANDPLGVCSVYEASTPTITCPVRFREDWIIADDAAAFFFHDGVHWTSLVEVRLKDKHGQSAGNVDVVLVSYDDRGRITDFGCCEVQAVYISGNVRLPFEYYMQDQSAHADMIWSGKPFYPRPDYLSSSRKRLAPQLLYKGGIFHAWGKKQAIVIHQKFFDTLPKLVEVDAEQSDLAWLIYDLVHDPLKNVYQLKRVKTAYTNFEPAMLRLTTADCGPVENFVEHLQSRLDEILDNPPDAPILTDIQLT